jgi:TolB-like protein/regulator of sirC expression with transglutaminase-like and TPR domain
MTAAENKAVFLSYASQDADAARRICDALRAAGIEVWFDQSELRGGDAWDANIRKQIKECALFVPVISANTQARREGYFRVEWKLAAQRTHAIAEGTPFLLPSLIDATSEPDALVPSEFREVQWTRLSPGDGAGDFPERVRSLLGLGARTSPSATIPTTGVSPAGPEKATTRKPALIATAVAVVILLGAGWWWNTRNVVASGSVADNSVAVLAFKNQSADPANEYLSDGISEEIASRLGTVPGLRVPATASSFQFKGKTLAPQEIARQLNVSYLLDGSVQRDGERVRVRAQLINARDGVPIWTPESFDRELKDLFKLQDEIATLIAKQLRLQLRFAFTSPDRRVNPQAFQLYLQGRQVWSERSQRNPNLDRAKELFRSAIALDPKFAAAHAGLADAMLGNRLYRWRQRASSAFAEAAAIADQALKIDPASAEAHTARGLAHLAQWNFAAAEQSLRTAVQLNPNYAYAYHLLGRTLPCQGRVDEALEAYSRAVELDPMTSRLLDNYAGELLDAGRFSAALAQAERALAVDPANTQASTARLLALTALERKEEALTLAREVRTRWELEGQTPRGAGPTFQMAAAMVRTYMRFGLTAEAEIVAGPDPRLKAWALLDLTGRIDELSVELDPESISTSELAGIFLDPRYDPIRSEPKFVQCLATLGVTQAHERAQAWRAKHPLEKPATRK